MTTPEPAVRITMSDIYKEVRDLRDSVRPMACDLKDLRVTAHEFAEDVEARLRALEAARFPWKVVAGVAAIIGILGTLVTLFAK